MSEEFRYHAASKLNELYRYVVSPTGGRQCCRGRRRKTAEPASLREGVGTPTEKYPALRIIKMALSGKGKRMADTSVHAFPDEG